MILKNDKKGLDNIDNTGYTKGMKGKLGDNKPTDNYQKNKTKSQEECTD